METQSITPAATITDKQKKRYMLLVENAAEQALKQASLSKNGAQNLLENSRHFESEVANELQGHLTSSRFIHKYEELTYDYPEDYEPLSIAQQVACLHGLFPEIGDADESIADLPLPLGAEGWFAIPRWEKVASMYHEACLKVLELIRRKHYVFSLFDLDKEYENIRQHKRSIEMWKKIGEAQKGHDILVVPAQFGLRYRGRSARYARERFSDSEFGLGAFEVLVMWSTHPKRLSSYPDLYIICAGDVFSRVFSRGDGRFKYTPVLGKLNCHNPNAFEFANVRSDSNIERCHYGAATAFLPQ